jgi:hypothetical protein
MIMKRQEKYPETKTFHYHNANPKNRITTDCVIRAIATALDQDYNKTVMEMAEMQCKTGYDDGDAKLYDKYLQSKGWVKHSQPRKWDNTKFTGEEWCRELAQSYRTPRFQRMVANIGGHHTVAIINYKVWDIWDSTDGCIGNYWVKAQ